MDSKLKCPSKDVGVPSTISSETNSEVSLSFPFQPSSSTGSSSCQSHEYLSGVPLHYEIVHRSHDHSLPPGIKDIPCVLLHGMPGTGNSMKPLSQHLPFKTYILPDLRNHGKSPSCPNMGFDLMTQDVLMLLDKLNIEEAAIIGHSAGGRTAMAVALSAPTRIAYLGVLDVAPVYTEEEFFGTAKNPRGGYGLIELLNAAPLDRLSNREEVGLWLKENNKGSKPLPDKLVQYLLENLTTVNESSSEVTDDHKEGISPSLPANSPSGLRWAVNLPHFMKWYRTDSMNWPFNATQTYTRGPVVLVKGLQSSFVQPYHLPILKTFFPKADFRTVDRTHLLHYEAPDEVAAQIIDSWKASASY